MLLLLAAGWSTSARAEGPGVRLGDSLVLHPGISVGAGYDSNLFYAPDEIKPGNEARVGAFYFSLKPSVDLATPSLQRGGSTPHLVDFRLHAGVPFRFLVSNEPAISRYWSVGAEAGLLLTVNPFGAWSFDLFDNFMRSSDPPYSVVKANFTLGQNGNINLDNNQAGMRLRWRPGGQRFETALQYTFGVSYFENDYLKTKASYLNDFILRFKWNFFPKTALYLNLQESIFTYPNSSPGTAMSGGQVNTPPTAFPFRATVGLIGLITTKFSVNLNVGYGNSFTQTNKDYPQGGSYSSVVAAVDLSWKPTVLTALGIGYKHDLSQSLIGTYLEVDGASISLAQLIWRINAGLRLAWDHRQYHGDLVPDGLTNTSMSVSGVNRTDDLLSFHVQFDYAIRDWFFVTIGDDLVKNFSNCRFTDPNAGKCDYLRNDVWLRFSLLY